MRAAISQVRLHDTHRIAHRILVGLFLLALSLATGRAGRIERERARIQEAKARGAEFHAITLSPLRLYPTARNEDELEPDRVTEYRSLLETAADLDVTPLGVIPTWVFPEYAGAPREPASQFRSFGTAEEVRLACVPEDQAEYERLITVRERMFASVARTFPEIRRWIVGYEPSFPFLDCNGRPLELVRLVSYVVDTLESVQAGLKAEQPDSIVIAHFLGRSGIPIYISGNLVQPSLLLNLYRAEIERRGDPLSDFLDQLVTDLDPTLLLDRFPETPVPVTLPRGLRSSLGLRGGIPGWVVKRLENFTTSTQNLVQTYSAWDNIRTPAPTEIVAVSGGRVELRLTKTVVAVAGAKSSPSVDFVPDAEFDSSTYEKDKWTIVSDFFPVLEPADPQVHAPAALRVNNRVWNGTQDQTRFAGLTFGGNLNKYPCHGEPCGAIQFEADKVGASPPGSLGQQKLLYFPLSQSVFNPTSQQCQSPPCLYRSQIMERQYFDVLNLVFELQWRAEVWNLTTNKRIGDSNWVWEWSVENSFGIEIPELSNSLIAFGWAPGTDDDGGIDAERVGTSYWNY